MHKRTMICDMEIRINPRDKVQPAASQDKDLNPYSHMIKVKISYGWIQWFMKCHSIIGRRSD
jgi:hypothetical protein